MASLFFIFVPPFITSYRRQCRYGVILADRTCCKCLPSKDLVTEVGLSSNKMRRSRSSGGLISAPGKIQENRRTPQSRGLLQAQETEGSSSGAPSHPSFLPFLRMTSEDERLASTEGHFVQRLQEVGLLTEDGVVTELGQKYIESLDAIYIHLTINKMLSMNRRYQTILAVVRDVGLYMGPVNIATAMHRLGRLVRSARAWNPSLPGKLVMNPQYQYLLRRADSALDGMAPRALANFLWGMAALGDIRHTGMVLRIGQRLLEINPDQLKTQELSNVVWALATLDVHKPELMDRMLDSACQRIDDCVPQALSNMIWACATLRHHHPKFTTLVASNAAPRLHEFQSQTLANTLWAYSVLGIYPTELFNRAADEVVRRFEAGRALKLSQTQNRNQDMTETSEALSGSDSESSTAMSNATGDDISFCFRGQEISNVLIAYARGCIIHPQLLRTLELELCSMVEMSREGEVVQVEWLEQFTSQALANTIWAFASLRWYPARLLPSITKAIGHIVSAMTAQELANSLWAYARFAYHPGRVLSSYLSVIEGRLDEFEGQACTNSLWALAVLKATHSNAFIGLLDRYVILVRSSSTFGELQYNQVLQAVLLAQFEERGGRVAWRPEVDLPEDVVDRALDAWASQQMATQLSGFHLDVSEGLTRLGVPHRIEHLVARNLLSIDIAIIEEDRRVAIEVDGPFHFPVNARTPLGHTMIRRRLLRAAGWNVISIPWHEWFAMETWEERLTYLANLLAKADGSFTVTLQSAMRELLSTDFAPGPGKGDLQLVNHHDVPGVTSGTQAGFPVGLEVSEDGPVLSYYSSGKGCEVDNGLMQALSRNNVQLTPGAMRRLQSMGLEEVVRGVEERRAAGAKQDKEYDWAKSTNPDVYAPQPSMGSQDGLLPKPRLPQQRQSRRFVPRIFRSDSDNDEQWGYFPPDTEEGSKNGDAHAGKARARPKRGGGLLRGKIGQSGAAEAVIKRVLHGRDGFPNEDKPSIVVSNVEEEKENLTNE